MSERCEPPPEWRGKDGWHWVDSTRWVQPDILRWRLNSDSQEYEWLWLLVSSGAFVSSESETANAWRYIAPATPPATVTALVEALEALTSAFMSHTQWSGEPPNEVVNARAILARINGEAGR